MAEPVGTDAPVPAIGSKLSQLAAEAPDRPAVTCEGRTLTRGELESITNRLARAYAELGVAQGDYVTVAWLSGDAQTDSVRGVCATSVNRGTTWRPAELFGDGASNQAGLALRQSGAQVKVNGALRPVPRLSCVFAPRR